MASAASGVSALQPEASSSAPVADTRHIAPPCVDTVHDLRHEHRSRALKLYRRHTSTQCRAAQVALARVDGVAGPFEDVYAHAHEECEGSGHSRELSYFIIEMANRRGSLQECTGCL